jgi:Ca2+-binding RTX toxin-like protein
MRRARMPGYGYVAVAAVAAMALGAPAVASAAAGSVGENATTLLFQAGPGTQNVVQITTWAFKVDHFVVRDQGVGATLQAATGCRDATSPAGAVDCTRTGVTGLRVLLGDRADTLTLIRTLGSGHESISLPTRINGGPGNDSITGGVGGDVIIAGPGVNTVRGNLGDDRLEMRNATRDALIDCGVGNDTAVVDRIDPIPIGCETVLKPS